MNIRIISLSRNVSRSAIFMVEKPSMKIVLLENLAPYGISRALAIDQYPMPSLWIFSPHTRGKVYEVCPFPGISSIAARRRVYQLLHHQHPARTLLLQEASIWSGLSCHIPELHGHCCRGCAGVVWKYDLLHRWYIQSASDESSPLDVLGEVLSQLEVHCKKDCPKTIFSTMNSACLTSFMTISPITLCTEGFVAGTNSSCGWSSMKECRSQVRARSLVLFLLLPSSWAVFAEKSLQRFLQLTKT